MTNQFPHIINYPTHSRQSLTARAARTDLRYKSIATSSSDKVKVTDFNRKDSIIFKDKYGVRLKLSENNILNFSSQSSSDTNYIYAYKDTIPVGKLMLNTYAKKTYEIVLVSVNGAKIPAIDDIKSYLDKVYHVANVEFNVLTDTLTIRDLENFTHGGSGTFTVYNESQKKVLQAYDNRIKDKIQYLFFIENVTETEGVGGYNPLGYQCGFIYNGANNRTIAHEIGHGLFSLHHPFSDSKQAGKTDNLMDYSFEEELYHYQWDSINEVQKKWMKWRQDESEGESVDENDSLIIEILPNINTKFGFDIVSGSNENNISLANGQNTGFKIVLSNIDSCYIKLDDSIHFSIKEPILNKIHKGENNIIISSINDNKKHISKLIVYDYEKKDTLPVVNILSYPQIDINMYVYCVYDSKNNCSNFSNDINKINYEKEIKKMFSQAVVNLNEFKMEAIDIEFDKNHNGALDLFDDKDSSEIGMITNYPYPYDKKQSVAFFNVDVQRTYKIKDTIVENSDYLIFTSYNDPKIKEINRFFYYYDKDSLKQTITIKKVVGDTLFLNEQLNRTLYPNDYVWRNINGLSSTPQLISFNSNADITMAHEKLHKLGLHDLELDNQINLMNVPNQNIMIYRGTSFRKTELRNRPLLIRNKQGQTEKQWDTIIRTKKD